ncbi:hypothetical protein B0I31_10354 [Saccharothrix carnea]|uniref:Uncharacterized protein n=1 Tax=Saccharothrix carnea TaxID=1280637 RepID=A0A2P8ICW4_SACCR|nr:fatty-acid--CoA ligase [Saccharothrix carnea]PSL56305.1 hypothetical protein B0I31_10354 [Saccharothrix carnea]
MTSSRRVVRVVDGVADARADTPTVEELLEIRVDGKALSVTMRTPGDDFDLAAEVGMTLAASCAARRRTSARAATACADRYQPNSPLMAVAKWRPPPRWAT